MPFRVSLPQPRCCRGQRVEYSRSGGKPALLSSCKTILPIRLQLAIRIQRASKLRVSDSDSQLTFHPKDHDGPTSTMKSTKSHASGRVQPQRGLPVQRCNQGQFVHATAQYSRPAPGPALYNPEFCTRTVTAIVPRGHGCHTGRILGSAWSCPTESDSGPDRHGVAKTNPPVIVTQASSHH